MTEIRQHGKDLGFLYPAEGPYRQLLGPRKFEDKLHYTQVPIIPLPFPSITNLLEGTTEVSSDDRNAIITNMLKAESHHEGVIESCVQQVWWFHGYGGGWSQPAR